MLKLYITYVQECREKISMLSSNRKNIKDSKQISRLKIKWNEKSCLMKLTDDLDTTEELVNQRM